MLQLLLAPALSVSLSALSLPNALLFESIRGRDGRAVLFIRDCGRGNLPQDVSSLGVKRCEAWQVGFKGRGQFVARDGRRYNYAGDAATLEDSLRRGQYSEVWLFSGGGNLFEGVGLGRVLRQARMTVRVPNVERVRSVMSWPRPQSDVYCVSACTVAFMGGLFRFMDEGSTYEMHSASGVADSVSTETRQLFARGELRAIIAEECKSGRYWAAKLFRYFQNTLLLPTRYPQVAETETDYLEFSERGPVWMELSAEEEERDRDRLRREGEVALQDLQMRYERGCVDAAVRFLRQTPAAREPRAESALRIVEAMYEVSIKDTQSLTRESMLRMGILTQDLQQPPSP